MSKNPIALGFAIWAIVALYTYVRGMWWRFRARKRKGWARLYIGSVEKLRQEGQGVYEARRFAFAFARFTASLAWPYGLGFSAWWRLVKIYRLVRLWKNKG